MDVSVWMEMIDEVTEERLDRDDRLKITIFATARLELRTNATTTTGKQPNNPGCPVGWPG